MHLARVQLQSRLAVYLTVAIGIGTPAAPTPPRTLILDRGVETVIGMAVGLAVGYVTRVRHPRS
ncbi:MAG TPA: hypothetical protein VGE43_05835 [Acidimicrobiales bacterium]